MSTDIQLAKAGHVVNSQLKEQKNVPPNHETVANMWTCAAVTGSGETIAVLKHHNHSN